MTEARSGGWIRSIAAAVGVLAALLALPVPASGYIAQLKRYPYLTDVVGTSATVNWGTDRSSINGAVKWGKVGTESCTAHTTVGTRTAITVNGVSEYQWQAQLTGLQQDAQYCYRVYFNVGFTTDLLGTDSSPTFRTQLPAGSTQPFKFAVFGDWGKVDTSGQNPDQADVMSQIAASGARFAVTTGDNAYDVGSQKDYGDLYQVGSNTSSVFGPNFWKVPGASTPLFPILGNHDHNNSVLLTNWPQDNAAATSEGRYTTETYCCQNGTQSSAYPSAWYAFDAGVARFYILDAAWDDSNSGTADVYKDDYDNHWAPNTDQVQWLSNDLATHPRQVKFAFWHFPMHSDNQGEGSDPYLQGPSSLEGLLKLYNVTLGFSGHAHSYQRFNAPSGGIPTYATGGGGATLDAIGTVGCNPLDAYALGWDNTTDLGSACGSAPVPGSRDRVHHFLLVNVNGSTVTVTPTDELGRTFDPVTYNVPPGNADLSVTKTDSPDPVLAGQLLTYTLTVQNQGPSTAIATQLTDNLPAGVTFDSATPSQGSCAQSSGTVSCTLGTLAAGASASVEVKVRPQSAGSITNQASVSSSVADSNSANNSASASTTVNPAADLSLTKSDSPDPVLAGQLLTYTLTASNAGPSSASGVQITDNLPAGVTFDSATPSQGSCSQSAGVVTCALGTLTSGGSASAQVKVRPQDSGSIMNQASVSSAVADPNSANDSASAETTVNPVAGLSLAQSDAPDPVLVDQLLTYTLTAHNAGPTSASGVQVTDNLPGGVTFDSATPSQGSCSQSSGTVSCTLGTLSASQNATIDIRVRPQATGTITNQATVTSTVPDPDQSDNTASESTTVDPAADLSLTKTDSPDPVLAGQLLTYTLTAHNAGPSSATAAQVTDNLPAGVTFESATPSQGSCSEATVTCALGTLTSGQSATVDIEVRQLSTGSITNQASVSSAVADPNAADNSASATTTVNPAADLALTKTGEPDPALVGQQLTYTLEVVNTGPQSAGGVQVTDNLPGGVTFGSATPSQGSCSQSSGTITCALGTIANTDSASVEIKVTPQSPGTLTNQANVTSTLADPDSANNSATAGTTVDPAVDLSLTKADSPDPVLAGQLLTYTLTAHNAGPSDATNVQVNDTLPANVTFDSATPSQGSCLQSLGVVTCALGTLTNGQSETVDVKVRPQAAGQITNQASVSSDAFDGNAQDNSASASTTVNPAADLSLTKTDSPDPVLAGQLLTYTLTAHNAGPSDATGIQVGDTLPANVTFDSATPSQGSCSESSGTVGCALGTLASGASATVDVKVRPQAPGQLTNQASVSSAVTDPSPVDNSASASTTVNPAADLSLQKTDSPDPVLAGQLLTYTLTAHNAGPSDATGVEIVDTLPAYVKFDSTNPSQGSCTESSGTVSCSLGAVPSGQDAVVEVWIRTQAAGQITNQASVSSDVADPNSQDNSASADTTVSPLSGYPRPKGATPVLVSLVPAYAACTSANATHGPPLASPSCKPPAQVSTNLTVGTLDANGAPANSSGFVRLDTKIGAVGPPDDSDVKIVTSITDVRCKAVLAACGPANTAAGPDYTGELRASFGLRLTDRFNGASPAGGTDAATVQDTAFPFTVACSPTIAATIGSTCSVATSANAVMPGVVLDTKRTIWQLAEAQVFDGGSDGLAATAADNLLFMDQGIFLP
jgi:uncharacterized repeat protein (TIGR01451 family)